MELAGGGVHPAIEVCHQLSLGRGDEKAALGIDEQRVRPDEAVILDESGASAVRRNDFNASGFYQSEVDVTQRVDSGAVDGAFVERNFNVFFQLIISGL